MHHHSKPHSLPIRWAPALIALACLGGALAAQASVTRIELPADGIVLKSSSLPGYARAQAQCATCHSAEYMQYQPATAPRGYWENMTKRMRVVFKAPIADEDIPPIVDYLVKTYGNEQAR